MKRLLAAGALVALWAGPAAAPLVCPDPETFGAWSKCEPGQIVEVRQRIRKLEAMVEALDARIMAVEIAKIAQKKGTSTGAPGLDNGN
jgi:hypothetical protein